MRGQALMTGGGLLTPRPSSTSSGANPDARAAEASAAMLSTAASCGAPDPTSTTFGGATFCADSTNRARQGSTPLDGGTAGPCGGERVTLAISATPFPSHSLALPTTPARESPLSSPARAPTHTACCTLRWAGHRRRGRREPSAYRREKRGSLLFCCVVDVRPPPPPPAPPLKSLKVGRAPMAGRMCEASSGGSGVGASRWCSLFGLLLSYGALLVVWVLSCGYWTTRLFQPRSLI